MFSLSLSLSQRLRDGDIGLSLGYILIPGEDEAARFSTSKFKINLFPRFEYFSSLRLFSSRDEGCFGD